MKRTNPVRFSELRLIVERPTSAALFIFLLVLAALGAPGQINAQQAERQTRTPARTPPQEQRPPAPKLVVLPLDLGNTELLSTEYLRRALRAAMKESDGAASAAKYAARYRISRELASQIIESATAEGVDPDLAFRLVRTESRFKVRARGPQGALGLTQLMPRTARSVDPSLKTEAAVIDPQNNLRVGFRYLRRMIEMFDGDVRLGLLAYNRGEGAVKRALRRGADPENGYSRKVLSRGINRYEGQGLLGTY